MSSNVIEDIGLERQRIAIAIRGKCYYRKLGDEEIDDKRHSPLTAYHHIPPAQWRAMVEEFKSISVSDKRQPEWDTAILDAADGIFTRLCINRTLANQTLLDELGETGSEFDISEGFKRLDGRPLSGGPFTLQPRQRAMLAIAALGAREPSADGEGIAVTMPLSHLDDRYESLVPPQGYRSIAMTIFSDLAATGVMPLHEAHDALQEIWRQEKIARRTDQDETGQGRVTITLPPETAHRISQILSNKGFRFNVPGVEDPPDFGRSTRDAGAVTGPAENIGRFALDSGVVADVPVKEQSAGRPAELPYVGHGRETSR